MDDFWSTIKEEKNREIGVDAPSVLFARKNSSRGGARKVRPRNQNANMPKTIIFTPFCLVLLALGILRLYICVYICILCLI